MLSIGKMRSGQEAYYASLAREDYYLEGGEPPGQWFGEAAAAFGLNGIIDNQVFRDLFAGEFNGKPLVQNAGKENRCPGWDLTFSAPKSVSVAWSQAEAEIGMEIRAAHLQAVEEALKYIEAECGWTRRGKEGIEREQAKLFFATFEHGTSRAQDPQLHTHALCLNACLRADGTTGTLETGELYRHKMAAGALYRAELSRQLEQRLGVVIHRTGSTFELTGVNPALMAEFSKRRREIEERLSALGHDGAVASERLALTSRSHKENQSREDLSREWKETGREHGWSTQELGNLINQQKTRSSEEVLLEARLAAGKALEAATRSSSTFTERDLVRFVAEEAQGRGVGAENARAAAAELLSKSAEIVRLGSVSGEIRYTTKEILELEKEMLERIGKLKQDNTFQIPAAVIKQTILERPSIKEEQAKAVQHVTAESRVAVVTGDAGTGKTFMLDAVREAYEKGGFQVLGAALSGKAAQGMQDGAKIQSETISSFLWRANQAEAEPNPSKRPLSEKSVLVIDEAAMVGTRQMAEIVRHVEEAGAKLILVGDAKQLQAIDMGGAFQGISGQVGEARLTEIIRQRSTEDRLAVSDMAEGRSRDALRHYAEKGNLEIAEDRAAARHLLMDQWKGQGIEHPEENLIVTSRNVDAVALNREAQKARHDAGILGKEAVTVAGEQIHPGDRILFTKNDRSMGVKNGQLGTVILAVPELKTLTVELDSGQTRTFSAGFYEHVRLGYAITTHKAQGVTAENAFILTDEAMQDREISYVQTSRARGETRIYTTRDEAGEGLSDLARRMERSREKELAIEQAKRARADEQILSL